MSQIDVLIEELIDSEIEGLIQEDSYYNLYATPLKPASTIKAEHRKQLKETFKLTDLRRHLDKAQSLILHLMPNYVPAEEFTKIKKEIEESGTHFIHFAETMSEDADKTIFLQDMFGLSNETLVHAYDLASDQVNKGHIEDAYDIFVFLGTMAPYVPSYWIAQGICLASLNRHKEAIEAFTAAKLLHPADPLPLAYIIESRLTLKEMNDAKQELEALKKIVKTLGKEDREKWEKKINNFKIP